MQALLFWAQLLASPTFGQARAHDEIMKASCYLLPAAHNIEGTAKHPETPLIACTALSGSQHGVRTSQAAFSGGGWSPEAQQVELGDQHCQAAIKVRNQSQYRMRRAV